MTNTQVRVFVVDQNGTPLRSCHPAKARRWVAEGKATPFYHKGFFTIRLDKVVGDVNGGAALGIDPGSIVKR